MIVRINEALEATKLKGSDLEDGIMLLTVTRAINKCVLDGFILVPYMTGAIGLERAES